MRKISFLFCISLSLLANSMFSQTTGNFNYQAVVRDTEGNLITNKSLTVQLSIIESTADGNEIYKETHSVTSTNTGLINLLVGNGTSEDNFASINWGENSKFIKIEVNIGNGLVDMGTFQLFSVPFAHYAIEVENKDDADANPTNEIQDLNLDGDVLTIMNHPSPTAISLAPFTGNNTDEQELSMNGDTLFISNGNNVLLPYDSSNWVINGNTMYYNGGNVGIGSSTPVSNLEVKGTAVTSDALFQVINSNNDTVFAVYPDGVKIFVDSEAKGKVGGFAISGRSPSKAGNVEIFRANIDSTRIYVSDTVNAKGKVGGFAISGRSPSKGVNNDYMLVTGDSTRIYFNDTSTVKGKVGGFAISGRSPSKGPTNDYLQVTKDSTRIYVNETDNKTNVYGFSVSGRDKILNKENNYLNLGEYSSKIFSKTSIEKQNEWASWNLLVDDLSSNYDTVSILKASRGNISMVIPYASEDISGNPTSSFDLLIKVSSKRAFDKFVSVGTENISLGTAGPQNITGLGNVFIGNADFGSASDYCGDKNIAIGYDFFANGGPACIDQYSQNIIIGTGIELDGNNNLFIGNYAGSHEWGVVGNNNIMIGDSAGYWETESNRFYIDNMPRTNLADQQSKAMFYGQFNVNPLSQFLQINARLGIGGAWNPAYALYVTGNAAVTGNVTATSFIATMSGMGAYMYNTSSNMNVPDYVFDYYIEGKSTQNSNYEMLSISDLKQYINKNRHLPRVPSRTEIEKDGAVNLQGLSMITLEKVEENTLYIIELEEKSIQQQQIIEDQKNKISSLEERLTEIEKLLMAKE